jgi:hypothetical protein
VAASLLHASVKDHEVVSFLELECQVHLLLFEFGDSPIAEGVCSVIVDLGAGGRQDVPAGAELIEALAVGVSGGVVAGVVVERVPGVGQLGWTIRSGGCRDEAGGGSGACVGGTGGGDRGPGAGAVTGAGGGGGGVFLEQLHGAPGAVDEDGAQRVLAGRHRHPCPFRRSGGRVLGS